MESVRGLVACVCVVSAVVLAQPSEDAGAIAEASDGGAIAPPQTEVSQTADGGVALAVEPSVTPACAATGKFLRVESIDGNKKPVAAKVTVDDEVIGTTPQTLKLTTCHRRAVVENLESHEQREVALATTGSELLQINWDGRWNHWSLLLYGDLTFFDPPLTGAAVPIGQRDVVGTFGGGLRLDRWARYFHFTLGLGVNPTFATLVPVPLPVLPAIDLFFGVNFRPGNNVVRAVLSVQAGLWQLVTPTVRSTVGLLLFERLLVTVSGDARILIVKYLPVPNGTAFKNPAAFGLSMAAGVAF